MLPDAQSPRLSPIQSVTITNADVDHTLGVILLRESQRLSIYSSDFVRAALVDGNAYYRMLQQFEGQTDWRTVNSGESFQLPNTQIQVQSVALEGAAPFWAKKLYPDPELPVMGLVLSTPAGAKLGYFPCVAKIDGALKKMLQNCDAIFFDGTFWTDDEIQRVKGGARSGRDMGHVAMSGHEGSLAQLKDLPASTKKFFIHINNTNPALNEAGPEHKQILEAGWQLAQDGMEFEL